MTTPVTINAEQRRILVRYAAGEELPGIAKATRIDGDLVNALVSGPLVKFDRRRAAELVRAYDRLNGQAELARQMSSAVRVVSAAPAPTVRPSVRDLLDEAGKVRALLNDIRERLDGIQADQEARAEVARLEAELAAAKARLRGGKPAAQPSEPVSPASGEPSPAELRAWAAAHGIDCPAFGRIPKHVREAWDEERAA